MVPGRLLVLSTDGIRFVEYLGYKADDAAGHADLNDVLSIVGCDDVLSEPFDANKLVFFKIINSTPNARILQHTWHLGGRPQVLRVATYNLAQGRGDSVVLRATAEIQCLDLRYLSSGRFVDTLQSMWLFASKEPGALMVLKDDVENALNSDAITAPLALTDVGGDASAGQTAALLAMHSRHHSLHNAGRVALEALATQRAISEVGVWSLQGPDILDSTIDNLEQRGYLMSRDSPEGKQIAVSVRAVHWDCFLRCSKPFPEIVTTPSATNICKLPKLDMIAILHRQGFTAVSDKKALSDKWKAGDWVYKQQNVLSRGFKAYFACLIR